LVEDRARSALVALKRLRIPAAAAILRLKREFRLLAPLEHPNLVRLHDLWCDEREPFFTMEYVEGRDLRAVLGSEPSSAGAPERLRLAFDVGRQVLAALVFMHSHGLVHRDLKPSNLLMRTDRFVKVVDFGTVAAFEGGRGLDWRGGTPAYAAPELRLGEPITAAADLYSLGVILSEVILKVAAREATRGLARERFEREGCDVPARVRALCTSLLEEDARRRPDAASALRALDPPGTPPRRSSGRRPAAVGIEGACEPPEHRSVSAASVAEVPAWLAARLEAVSEGGFDLVVVERGVCACPDALRDHATALGGIVLAGGRRRGEHLEYNVLDAAIDALAALCLDTSPDAELARDLALASYAFPVFAGPRAAARSTSTSRSRAFDAVIRIMASFAGAGGVHVVLDGMERADAGSLALLDRLLERRPPGVGVVAALDERAAPRSISEWLETHRRLARERVHPGGACAWVCRSSARPQPFVDPFVGSPLRIDPPATRGLLEEPQDAGELDQPRGDVPAIGAESHAQPVRRLLLTGGRLDEGELQRARLLRAARR
jgi:serine/threonine protein kinase